MATMMLLSATAGIVGTGIGGVLGLLFADSSNKSLSCMLAFAAGIMVSIVSFELLPEAMILADIFTASMGMVAGMAVMVLISWIMEKLTDNEHKKLLLEPSRANKSRINRAAYEDSLYKSGVTMLIAITLHNFPEGIAIGSGGSHSLGLGVGIALVIALHDVPEGMAISAPLVAGGMRRIHVVFLTALSGASTLIGAIAGYALGGISDGVTSFAISSAGGAMMYVVFGEIFPESMEINKDKSPSIAALLGFLIGMLFVKL